MGKHKDVTKGASDAQKDISHTPSSHVGETGNKDDVDHDLKDEVASLEEALLQMDASSIMPFYFTWHGRPPSEQSLSPEHWHNDPAHDDLLHYCVQVRVTLGEGGGDQPQPSLAWTGL